MTDRSRVPARIDRRTFLSLSGMSAAALIFGAGPFTERSLAEPTFPDYPFKLGVASGDPLPDGVVLWTRLAPDPLTDDGRGGMPSETFRVRFEVAEDERFSRIVQRGAVDATPELAHSVHAEVGGLAPGREYFYRFKVGTEISPVGRTKTAPAFGSPVSNLTFAFASCQSWPDGYYSAYRRMAEEDLDLVVHLGDYIYEYGIDSNGGFRNVPVSGHLRNETKTLGRYRLQYALYKSDPDLQRAHALFPWIVTWDDHEVENDYTDGIPQDPPGGKAFLDRRAAAYQAYYEHLPLRRSSMPKGPDMPIYRRLAYGDLAEFSVLDTRQYRSDHPCGDGEHPRCAASFDPAQTMTGPEQERWLLEGLDRSQVRWNVIAQQVLMAELDHKLGEGEVFWQDSWDGYPLARNRVLSHIASRQIPNPVVITGDWHSTFVSDLKLDFKDPNSATIATEFTGTSISSNGDQIVYGPYYGPMIPENPHIKFFDGDRRGYVRCSLDHEQWLTDLRMVTTVSRPDAPVYTLASFVVEDGVPGAQQVGGAQEPARAARQPTGPNPRIAIDKRREESQG
jgi:alkaline phosphatase D